MNPRSTYNSLKRKISLVKLTLLILLFQVSILLVSNVKIGLPKFASDYIIDSIFLDSNITLDYERIKFTARGDVWFNNLKLYLPDLTGIKCRKGKLSLNRSWIFKNQKILIDNFSLEGFSFQSQKFKFHDIEIEKLESCSLKSKDYHFDIKSVFLRNSMSVKGVIAQKVSEKSAFKKIDLSTALKALDKELGQHLDKLSQVKFENFNLKVNNLYSLTFFLKLDTISDEINDNKYTLNSCTAEFTFQENPNYFNGFATAEYLNYSTVAQSVKSQQIEVNVLSAKNISSSSKQVSIECGNTNLAGKITGLLEPFNINFNFNETQSNLCFISSNTSLKSCISYKNVEDNSIINGFAFLNPRYLSLECIKNDIPLKVFSGDSLRLLFCKNQSPTDESYKTLFTLQAKNFSALEVPLGDYNFVGEIKNDLSLKIRKALGTMGKSIVEGSYSQTWNPLAFEFRLTGNCFPTDINNWLGPWWGKLWENFSFPEDLFRSFS